MGVRGDPGVCQMQTTCWGLPHFPLQLLLQCIHQSPTNRAQISSSFLATPLLQRPLMV